MDMQSENIAEEISVTVVLSPSERSSAVSFIEKIMKKSFECDPPPTTGVICAAYLRGEIVGTLVLVGSTGSEKFPIEKHYEFQEKSTPFLFERSKIVQAGRWIATTPEVSIKIIKKSVTMLYELGKRYILIEAKSYSVKRMAELGISCIEIPNATLLVKKVLSEVGANGMKYYLTEPTPKLYMVELAPIYFSEALDR